MPQRSKQLPHQLLLDLYETDLFIHAGDWSTVDVYDEFNRYAPVKGVTTDKRKQPFYSYGVLTVQETVHFQHVFFHDKT